jgi:hypothetical protein
MWLSLFAVCLAIAICLGVAASVVPRLIALRVKSQEVSMGKLTAERKVREYNRGQKAASEGRSRSWSEPWAYPFESDQHYEERREAFNQGYGIIDTTPVSVRRPPP